MTRITAPSPRHWLWFLTGCLLLIAAVLLRSWPSFTHTGFYAEDAVLFSHYYDRVQPISDVARDFFGQPYKTLVTSFFAWLIAFADVRIQPYLYLWIGFAWGIAAACCFFASSLIRSRPVLLFGPLLTGLVAFNHIFYYNTLIFVMYTSLAFLLALFYFPTPKTVVTTFLTLILYIALPWSGPFSAVVVPISLMLLVLFWSELGRKQWLLPLAGLSALAYYFTVQGGTTSLGRLTNRQVIASYLESLLDRIIFFDLFAYVPLWMWLPILLIICGSMLLFRKDTVFIRNSLVMLATIAGSFTLFYLSSKYPIYIQPKPCHRFVSLFFWCIYLLYLAEQFFKVYGEGRITVSVFVILIGTIIISDNRTFCEQRMSEIIPDTDLYITAIYNWEEKGLKAHNQYVILRQYNYQHPFFYPWVQVGSRRFDAVQILRYDLPCPEGVYLSPWPEVRPILLER